MMLPAVSLADTSIDLGIEIISFAELWVRRSAC